MKLTLTAIALVAICSGAALAEQESHPHKKDMDAYRAREEKVIEYFFRKADTNGDGRISMIEHEAAANSMFRNADTNHDNVLTLKEVVREHDSEMKEARHELGWDHPADHPMRDDHDDDKNDDSNDM